MIRKQLSEMMSNYSLKNKKVATIIVSRTRKQRRQLSGNVLLSVLSFEMIFGLLYFVKSNQISKSLIYSIVGFILWF